jgi:hypothetical protein
LRKNIQPTIKRIRDRIIEIFCRDKSNESIIKVLSILMNVDRMAIKTFVYLKLLGILNGCVLAKIGYLGKIK